MNIEIPFRLNEDDLSPIEVRRIKYLYLKAKLTEDNVILHSDALMALSQELERVKVGIPIELINYVDRRTKELKKTTEKIKDVDLKTLLSSFNQ